MNFPQANRIYPSVNHPTPRRFEMCYCPPPTQIEFTFNMKVEFSQQDVDDIMGGFGDLIRRDTKFMAKFLGAKILKIRIIKSFHFDEGQSDGARAVEHINCKFFKDDDEYAKDTYHVYFTRSRKSITQISSLIYEKFEF